MAIYKTIKEIITSYDFGKREKINFYGIVIKRGTKVMSRDDRNKLYLK
jgi:hypothetical protein